MTLRAISIFPVAAIGAVVPPQAIELAKPVNCVLGSDCFVQQYHDHDPGPGARDFRCGSRSYDGHDGFDIRVPDSAVLTRGVAIIASAPGIVRNVRDGEEERSPGSVGDPPPQGRECGNGVVIAHTGGWETQYCHMRRGSVAVRPGQSVGRGGHLGLVGLSGDTEFPHLHFSVREGGKKVDPFAYQAASDSCGGGASLWSKKAERELRYKPVEILNAGFASKALSMGEVEDGGVARVRTRNDPIVFYARAIGVEAGDILRLTVLTPDGRPLVRDDTLIDRPMAQYLAFAGRRSPASGWSQGRYVGKCEVLRHGRVASVAERTLSL
jgi:hypothetical protein